MTRRRTPARRRPTPAPKPAPAARRALSVRYELGELQDAVAGARMLIDIARHRGGDSPNDQRRAPRASAAVLGLVDARMQLLERVLAGDVDSRLALTTQNETGGSAADLARFAEDDLLIEIKDEV